MFRTRVNVSYVVKVFAVSPLLVLGSKSVACTPRGGLPFCLQIGELACLNQLPPPKKRSWEAFARGSRWRSYGNGIRGSRADDDAGHFAPGQIHIFGAT